MNINYKNEVKKIFLNNRIKIINSELDYIIIEIKENDGIKDFFEIDNIIKIMEINIKIKIFILFNFLKEENYLLVKEKFNQFKMKELKFSFYS